MVTCAILGDSLAAGVAAVRSDCCSDTQVGITSTRYAAAHLMVVTADIALVSLGVNDGAPSRKRAENLFRLRAGVQSRQVYWMLPARPAATRALIHQLAHTFGDKLIETKGFTGQDGLHLPASAYRTIASVFDLPTSP